MPQRMSSLGAQLHVCSVKCGQRRQPGVPSKVGMAKSYMTSEPMECEVAVNDDTGFDRALKDTSMTNVRDRIGPRL